MADGAPRGMQLDRSDRKHEQAETAVAENALDPVERRGPHDNRQHEAGDHDQPAVQEPGQQLQADRHPADLRGQCHEVDHLCTDECCQPGSEAEPLSHRIEDRLAGHRCDAAAHLRVDDDSDDADHDDPEQLIAEGRAGRDVEDEVADVDETADRGEDSERNLEDLHFASLSAT